jgi:hypothetical protein
LAELIVKLPPDQRMKHWKRFHAAGVVLFDKSVWRCMVVFSGAWRRCDETLRAFDGTFPHNRGFTSGQWRTRQALEGSTDGPQWDLLGAQHNDVPRKYAQT